MLLCQRRLLYNPIPRGEIRKAARNHVLLPWGQVYVAPPEILKTIDGSFEVGKTLYIMELPRYNAVKGQLPYYTSTTLTDVDMPIPTFCADGEIRLSVIRYVRGGASLGTIKRNDRIGKGKRF